MQKARKICYSMLGAGLPADAGTDDSGEFRKVVVGAGTATKDSQGLVLSVPAAAAAAGVFVHQDDVLAFDIDELQSVSFLARIDRVSADLANTDIVIGIGKAYDADPDAVTESIWYRVKDGVTYCETDDNGDNDNNEVDSVLTLGESQWQRYYIDLASGSQTVSPPGQPIQGGKTNITFHAADRHQSLRKVCENTLFDMGRSVGGFQLYFGIMKSGGDDEASLTIREIEVEVSDD